MEPRHESITDIESNNTTPVVSIAPISKEERSDGVQDDKLSAAEQRRVLRKIDVRVSFILGIINYISLMDRSNLGAAAVAGMSKDLELYKDNRYSVIGLIFFIPYVIFEFPSAILVRKVGTRPLLITICILWGVLMIGTGFVQTWQQLAGTRALLGFLESVFAPVVLYLLSSWYTRNQVQKRFALFFVVTIIVASFNGIMTYGLIQMHGLGGLHGWRWSFIMQGILTVVVGVIAGSLVVDFPDKIRAGSGFLTETQLKWVIDRLQEDRGDADTDPFSWSKFFKAAKYFHVWLFTVILCCCTTIAYSVGFYLPIILQKEMGFGQGAALCLSAPPYLFSAITAAVAGWIGDKYGGRGLILGINAVISIVGLALLAWTQPSGVRYLSVFIINGAVLANIPTSMAYSANNIRGQWPRAFGSASFVVGGGLGGIFGALMFGNGEPAAALRGVEACIGVSALLIVVVIILTLFFRHQNGLARRGRKLIYNHPGFLYTL